MTDQHDAMAQKRHSERHDHLLTAEIDISGESTNGQIINWSKDGLQILSVIPLDPQQDYRFKLHIQRDRIDDEGRLNEQTWLTEGAVKWSEPYKDGSWIGVQFDKVLDIPVDEIHEFFTVEDFIHIYLFTGADQLNAWGSYHEEDSMELIPSSPWSNWLLWGIIIVLQILILLILWQGDT